MLAAWNPVRCEGLHEDLIKQVADAMVSSGLREAGYTYLNIDDCWMSPQRNANGHLLPHPKRFPNGMKALGDYIHSRGLRFGIYSCAGYNTCEGWPASFGHEMTDAADWASWGVDYLKYDFCGLDKVPSEQKEPKKLYAVMRDALNATGRPILFSLCNWGVGEPHLWGHEVVRNVKPPSLSLFVVKLSSPHRIVAPFLSLPPLVSHLHPGLSQCVVRCLQFYVEFTPAFAEGGQLMAHWTRRVRRVGRVYGSECAQAPGIPAVYYDCDRTAGSRRQLQSTSNACHFRGRATASRRGVVVCSARRPNLPYDAFLVYRLITTLTPVQAASTTRTC